MPDYLGTFLDEDKERVLHFVTLFSRWECALKYCQFARAGSHDQAEADWNAYADAVGGDVDQIDEQAFASAIEYVTSHPPKRQMIEEGGGITWQDNPRRHCETDARYLFRVLRDVRNNLFHGGKYLSQYVEEIARDRKLIDGATRILEACIILEEKTRGFLSDCLPGGQGTESDTSAV